jgi:hypothetical protein
MHLDMDAHLDLEAQGKPSSFRLLTSFLHPRTHLNGELFEIHLYL